jgi:hypothetical protein
VACGRRQVVTAGCGPSLAASDGLGFPQNRKGRLLTLSANLLHLLGRKATVPFQNKHSLVNHHRGTDVREHPPTGRGLSRDTAGSF